LSEVLEVPTTIETGEFGLSLDFYNVEAKFDYGVFGYDYPDLLEAQDAGGDCRLVKATNASDYKPCAHIFPEVWKEDLPELDTIKAMEPLYDLGTLARQGWYIPLFTVRHDPSLANYVGLQGEQNRIKLAEIFKRPTNWKQYCEEVSENNCTVPDAVATRPPADEWEESSYFVQGEFTGHFRFTSENNCALNPNCTGHFGKYHHLNYLPMRIHVLIPCSHILPFDTVEYPCNWGSFFSQQSYHLGIALESNGPERNGGYQIEQIMQIFDAANATKNHVIGMWSFPDATTSHYAGTESELTRISLPEPTQECTNHRIDPAARCEIDLEAKIGSPEGACDYSPSVLKKMIGTAMKRYDTTIPEELTSPAYEFLREYRIENLQLDQILQYWFEEDTDEINSSLREAVCRWVAENVETISTMAPASYPRVAQVHNRWKSPLHLFTFSWACFAAVYTLGAAVATYTHRQRSVMMKAQLDFLALLLFGLLLVSLGSVVFAGEPSGATCMVSEWLVMLGYSTEIIPLIVKVTAINKIMLAAKKMRRVRIEKNLLYKYVAGLSGLTVLYLIVWTLLDPSQREGIYTITGDLTQDDATIVSVYYQCSSTSKLWLMVYFVWHIILLACATVLAVQNRKIHATFNEAKVLAALTYSHGVFLVGRVILFLLEDSIDVEYVSVLLSMSLSTGKDDTIIMLHLLCVICVE